MPMVSLRAPGFLFAGLYNFCIGSNFYVEPPSGDAMPTTAVNLMKKDQWNEIHLTHVEKISKTGNSGLTFGINKPGWSPVADASPNEVYFDGRIQAKPAQLVIIYKENIYQTCISTLCIGSAPT